MSDLIDISPLIDVAIHVWPGDTPFVHTVNLDMHSGDNLTLSDIRTSVHVGAHTDAPSHYLIDGRDIAAVSLEPYIGLCQVMRVAVQRGERILPAHIADHTIRAPRVLFRTETFPDPRAWNNDFAALSPELAEFLATRGVVLAGVDTPSVDLFDSKALEAHNALAGHGIAILEGIVLSAVDDGLYELIALPLRIARADASPVRAILRRLN